MPPAMPSQVAMAMAVRIRAGNNVEVALRRLLVSRPWPHRPMKWESLG
jgi:hypothetical protein